MGTYLNLFNAPIKSNKLTEINLISNIIPYDVEKIFLIFENKKILNLKIGIKKKNYNISITKKYLENLLIESKDLFRDHYHDQEIMHMIINKYFFNSISYQSFQENLKCDHLALEIEFKFISNKCSIIFEKTRSHVLGLDRLLTVIFLELKSNFFL